MSARDLQRVLARLYTDEAMLAEFLADRNGFCQKFAGAERDFFAQIDAQQLEFFARTLQWKRAREVEKLLPLTASALRGQFCETFLRYSTAYVPTGDRKHVADAMAFCAYLLASEPRPDKLVCEAARYEGLRLRMHFRLVRRPTRPTFCWVQRRRTPWLWLTRFAYELPALTEATIREPQTARPTRTIFVRIPGLCGVWYW